jgi:predicted HAD superfamily phosphohydrolase YqeG
MGKRQIHIGFWCGSLTEGDNLEHVGVVGDIIKTDFKDIERKGVHSVIVVCIM